MRKFLVVLDGGLPVALRVLDLFAQRGLEPQSVSYTDCERGLLAVSIARISQQDTRILSAKIAAMPLVGRCDLTPAHEIDAAQPAAEARKAA